MSGWDGDALAGQMEDAQERAEQAAEDRKRLRDVRADDRKRSERMESLRALIYRLTQRPLKKPDVLLTIMAIASYGAIPVMVMAIFTNIRTQV